MKRGRWSVVGGLVVAVTLLAWPGDFGRQEASAADGSVAALVRLAHSDHQIRSLDALEKLRRLGTHEAVDALGGLTESRDNRLAIYALSSLARSGSAGAERKIQAVYQDAERSDALRTMALALWCRKRAKDGASWEEIRGFVEAGAGSNTELLDAAASLQKSLFATKAVK